MLVLCTLTSAEEYVPPSSVIMFNKETSKKDIFDSPIKKQALFFTDENDKHHEPAMKIFEKLAEDFSGDLLVIRIPFSETEYAKHFYVERDALPALFAIDMTDGMQKIPYGGDVLNEELTMHFIAAFVKKELDVSVEL